eukprot:SAG31_NODE_1611_length_7748_cov_2.128758_6_plen_79_part_00
MQVTSIKIKYARSLDLCGLRLSLATLSRALRAFATATERFAKRTGRPLASRVTEVSEPLESNIPAGLTFSLLTDAECP